jgi:hypothetical protein
MPDPPVRLIVPLGKHLLQPLHDRRKLQPIRRLDIKHQPVIRKAQMANLENKPEGRLPEHPGKDRQSCITPEQGFPVVDAGADLIPHPLP